MDNKKLSSSEAYLWQYINDHRDKIPELSIIQLAQKANVSTATIVRAMKKRNFSGYTNFRQTVIKENNDINNFPNFLTMNKKIKQAVLKNQNEVVNTIQQIDVGDIEDAIQKIYAARKIYLFARGFSARLAEEIEIKLQLLHKDCEFHRDPNIIVPIAKNITKKDLVIDISLNGNTEALVISAKDLAKRGVSILTITTNDHGKLIPYSEIAIIGYKQKDTYFPEYEVHSRLPLEVISRILLDAYAIRTEDEEI